MECPICMEQYDDKIKIPKNLTCGHTICEPCLRKVHDAFQTLCCPICKKVIDVTNINDIPKNFALLNMIETNKKDSGKMCQIHQLQIKWFCEDCKKGSCDECHTEHSGHHFFKFDESRKLINSFHNKGRDRTAHIHNSHRNITQRRCAKSN